jgi:hypothetical protein
MLNEHTNFMVHEIPKKDPSQKVFVPGWTNRQNDLGKYIETFAEGGIAHFDKGGKTNKQPDYTDYYNEEMTGADIPYKEPYPGYQSDKSMYEGIAKIPEKLLKLNPYSLGVGLGDMAKRAINEPIDEQARRFRSYSNRTAQANNPDKYVPPPTNVPTISPNVKPSNMADTTDYYRMESAANPPSSMGARPAPSQPSAPSEFNVQPSMTPMGPDADLANEPTSQTEASQTTQTPSARDTIQQMLIDRMSKQGESAEQDKYLALLNAGLGIMGGTSPYALQNIGAGGQLGIAAQMANKRNQMSEQNSILNGMLGLERANATDRYHTTQLAQYAEQRKAALDEVIRSHTATEEQKRQASLELSNLRTMEIENRNEARKNRVIDNARTALGRMEESFKRSLEAKYDTRGSMFQMNPDQKMKFERELSSLYSDPRYKALEKAAFPDVDFSLPTEAPVSKDRKPLTVFQK